MWARAPRSPPLPPTISLSPMTSGADVSEQWLCFGSSNWTVLTSSPVSAFVQLTLQSRSYRYDEILVQSDPSVRADPYIAFVDARVHDPFDPGVRRIAHIDPIDGTEPINNVHEAIIDERRALMAAQCHEPNAIHAAERDSEDRTWRFLTLSLLI